MGVKSFFSIILEHELENGDIDKLIQDVAKLIASRSNVQKVTVKKEGEGGENSN